jgi:hypothetical protein
LHALHLCDLDKGDHRTLDHVLPGAIGQDAHQVPRSLLSLDLDLPGFDGKGRFSVVSAEELEPMTAMPWSIYQDSSGGRNWDSRNHIDADGRATVNFRGFQIRHGTNHTVALRGDRATPRVEIGGARGNVAATVPDFWQNFPTAIRCARDRISIGLFPRECESPFELQGGERKCQKVWFGFADAESPTLDEHMRAVQSPLQLEMDPAWVAGSGAIPNFLANPPDGFDHYLQYVNSIVEGPDRFEARREVIDEYGWRNFGELYADHEAVGSDPERPRISHYNNQYDFVHAAGFHFLRTGDSRWHQLMVDASRHTIDIDVYHTTRDRAAYNGGLFWHTDHYKDAATATHRTYSKSNGPAASYGGGPANEHLYTSGLLLCYYLTGDISARDTVTKLADWPIAVDDGSKTLLGIVDGRFTGKASATASPDYHKAGRGGANCISALLDGHELTGERRYMEKAEQLILRCIHPGDRIEELDLTEPETRWSYVVFLQVLGKYLEAKSLLGEYDYYFQYSRDSLVHYACWMLDNEVPYMEVLDKVDIPSETWPAQDIRKSHVFGLAASLSVGELRERFLERARYFFRRSIDDVLGFETAYLTRPRVIIAAYGHAALYFQSLDPSSIPEPFRIGAHEYNFGAPETFVPQGAQFGAYVGGRLRLFSTEVGRLLKERSGLTRLRARLWKIRRNLFGRRR